MGAGTRGASLGVDAVKVAALNAGDDLFDGAVFAKVPTFNELLWNSVKMSNAKRLSGVLKVCQALSSEVNKALTSNEFPFIIGGDHSIGAGSLAGLKAAFPDKRIGAVWIDAHADLHTPYTTPSGNVHGMPLAAAIGTNNEHNGNNTPSTEEQELWAQFCSMDGIPNKVNAQDLVFIALRDTEAPEDALIAEHGMKVIRVDEVNGKGTQQAIIDSLEHLKDCDLIHLSYDVDSLDPSISVGTGTPVPNGLNLIQGKDLVAGFLAEKKVATFELVEVNPTLDTKNKMAECALELLRTAIKTVKERA